MRRAAPVLLCLCLALPIRAQEAAAPAAPDPAPKGDRAEPIPAYEAQLLRLSELLGSVHYLRGICGAKEEAWRADMGALLEAENPSPERRSRLIARFNRGYRGYAESYRSCTDSALVVLDRYMREGARIAQDIATRYGT